jgi:phage terminase large subunit
VASVCSYALPHLKIGVVRDLYQILTSFNENPELIHNKSDHYFSISKSTLEYFGITDNYAKVHGPRRDFLFINEANNKITYDDFDNLNQRTHICTFLDYNPRSEFWVHEQVIPKFKHEFIKSTFRDNPWLPDSEINKILWKFNKPGFENWWRVYGEGEVGILEGQIFTNWHYGEFDEDIPYIFGLDFGFNPDPDTLVKIGVDRKRKLMYWDECFYKNQLGQSALKDEIKPYVGKDELIVADCAENRLIYDLQADFNIKPVKKTGTVGQWLKLMQDYEHIITERSYNLAKEFSNYIWDDERAGVPVDASNHGIDGGRYCFMELYSAGKGAIIGMRAF